VDVLSHLAHQTGGFWAMSTGAPLQPTSQAQKQIFWKSVTMISCLGSFPTPDLLDISSLLRFGVLREQGLGAPLPDHFLTLGATGRGGT
jgi:hypothetical protein